MNITRGKKMNDFIVLLSMGLTPATIISAIMVVYLFWHPFVKALNTKDRSAVNWMIIGVTVNFTGGVLDNLWWAFAWSGDYVAADSFFRHFFFENGAYSNVIFRQGCGIIGALCHIRSAQVAGHERVKKVAIFSAIVGLLFVCFLVYLRANL